ncbi:DUF397 domain-containing protein [Catellatospora citrea]|uniref:DUF397 domain-containing protein n=1 Tax=Catellatospora citrea TaxID=53366 RepID=A0A8J3NYP4_9ACTN|nr:DUF397 domain-containing protein [Catellatospora citrea]RKE07399.1 uncharacterized protein DUF397 [Catellatospora citrea]GIF95555.1 hypothetical protein Cci01nite_06490 [Catellatospora citrea]
MTSDNQHVEWRVGSYCDSGACVEVGMGGEEVRIRRSRTSEPVVVFTREEWAAFLRSAKDGEFDR